MAAPVQLIDMSFIQPVHIGEQLIRDLLTGVSRHPKLVHFAHFAFDLIPALIAEMGQIVVECFIRIVQPLVLQAHPLEVADLGQGLGLVRQTKIDVD